MSATVAGEVTVQGASAVFVRGVCWSTNVNPTTSDLAQPDGNVGLGSFTVVLGALQPSTSYHARAYATNDNGTGYGANVSFTTAAALFTAGAGVTDIDGEVYPSIVFPNGQEWMSENLRTSRYRNGASIPEVAVASSWVALTTGAYCYPGNTTSFGATYGKLYNWYAVSDAQGVCPNGWHVPSDLEWKSLETFSGLPVSELDATVSRGVAGNVGGKLKSISLWEVPNIGATNETGFTARPCGARNYSNGGGFTPIGNSAAIWSSSPNGSLYAWARGLNSSNGGISRGSQSFKANGYCIRCLRD
ncbi:MAG: fibrobacter succinogenes major paralogous domain-containing protein [Flavobacteriales bacterium]|nr:fibrobacter succinogenes major paralogous domain-containing protein [Flavobacteriales bacterium]